MKTIQSVYKGVKAVVRYAKYFQVIVNTLEFFTGELKRVEPSIKEEKE